MDELIAKGWARFRANRHGLERLVRWCARAPFSQDWLGCPNEQTLICILRRPTVDGCTEPQPPPIDLLDLLAQLMIFPRPNRHRRCGVLAPNASLRAAVTASAGPAGTTLQLLEQARANMGLPSVSRSDHDRINFTSARPRRMLYIPLADPCPLIQDEGWSLS